MFSPEESDRVNALTRFNLKVSRAHILYPPKAEKIPDPVRFGILGAARIAPIALILAVASHPECVVTGVAARDERRARAFAKKHEIPKVYYGPSGYQSMVHIPSVNKHPLTHWEDLLDDPEIDVIYNPLPNGLHFEWTAKALEAGKNVLLEKPSANTAEEIQKLFEIATKKNLVLLEAFHYRFHPSFLRLKEIIQGGEFGKIKSVKSELKIPRGLVSNDDIRLDYSLGGGALMDMGVYPISAARAVVGTEPVSIISANHTAHPKDSSVDRCVDVVFAFPNDATVEIGCDMQVPHRLGFIPQWPLTYIKVQLEGGDVSLSNFPGPYIFHSITIKPKSGKARTETAYKYKSGEGEEWWTTYRYQLEAFMDKLKGREPKAWITAEDSINQMKVVEMVYSKLGLPPRPTSEYTPSL